MPNNTPSPTPDTEKPPLSHEESVFLLARQGNLLAQSQLVEFHQQMLRSFVAALNADPNSSDDLAQEVFIRALHRLDRVENSAALPAFLRGIARNVVREQFKKSQRSRSNLKRFMDWAEDTWESCHPHSQPPEHTSLLDSLQTCLQRLPEKSRSLLQLRYYEELTSHQIGETTRMSADAVRTSMGRIRKKLLHCMTNAHQSSP